MEGVSIIGTQTIKEWELRFANMEQMLLSLIKCSKEANSSNLQSGVPGFISIATAAKKYDLSRTTIYNKINLFVKSKGRDIDRLQTGTLNKVSEIELLEALRIKGEVPEVFKKKKKRDRIIVIR